MAQSSHCSQAAAAAAKLKEKTVLFTICAASLCPLLQDSDSYAFLVFRVRLGLGSCRRLFLLQALFAFLESVANETGLVLEFVQPIVVHRSKHVIELELHNFFAKMGGARLGAQPNVFAHN